MKILLSGGAGYIGSHTYINLVENGFTDVISVDNYSNSSEKTYARIHEVVKKDVKFEKANLADENQCGIVFETHKNIDAVIHFAALKSVPESTQNPLFYYKNNLNSLLNLLEFSKNSGVKYFIFSSSCSVYGDIEQSPVNEQTSLLIAQSPYAYTKQAGERIIQDLAKVCPEMQFISLRYFNPVGAHPSAKIGEIPGDRPANFVPIITETAAGIRKQLTVFGNDYPTRDGTCIRDYIHVCDIARAHTMALQYAASGKMKDNLELFNLGSGKGVSVMEAIAAFEKVSSEKINFKIGGRRDGDVAAIFSDSSKANQILNWFPEYSVDDMMLSAWKWQKNLIGESI